jgi:hypothetical protein
MTLVMSVMEYPGPGVHYVSSITTLDHVTGEQKPILELTQIGTTLHISFVLSTRQWIEKLAAGSPAHLFLKALHDLRHANDMLYKETTCDHRV